MKMWIIIFFISLWGLAYYICNQLFVIGYIRLQGLLDEYSDEDSFFSLAALYDYCAACFFGGVWIKLWTHVGHSISSLVSEITPFILKDRMHITVILWSELFSTVFGRIIFREVHLDSLLLIIMIKDSLGRVMDLTLRYNPTRMIRMAIREDSDN